jgi:hypothetical protein
MMIKYFICIKHSLLPYAVGEQGWRLRCTVEVTTDLAQR